MEYSEIKLDPNCWHESWYSTSESEKLVGQGASRPRDLLKWVVRLRFEQNGEKRIGTGFFLNVPASEWHVILTAAHNLVDDEMKSSKNLHVDTWDKEYTAEDDIRIEICPQYLKSCEKDKTKGHNANVDYGAILIPKASHSHGGFGFALETSQKNFFDITLNLIGYKPSNKEDLEETQQPTEDSKLDETQQPTKDLEPHSRSGLCLADKDGYLTYKMATVPGLSGSPIYTPFRGYDTVVAIHNNGETSDEKPARGARLSCETLEQIFDWVQLYSRRRALRASQKLTADAHGSRDKDPLYLHFVPQAVLSPEQMGEPENAWACIHRTKDGMSTYLDVLPGYSSPSSVNNEMLWAFRLCRADAVTQYWVLWDVFKKQVTLTDSLQEHCFVRLRVPKEKHPVQRNIPAVFYIVPTDPDPSNGPTPTLCQLYMNTESIVEEDLVVGQKVWPNLAFKTHHDKASDSVKKFVSFLLE